VKFIRSVGGERVRLADLQEYQNDQRQMREQIMSLREGLTHLESRFVALAIALGAVWKEDVTVKTPGHFALPDERRQKGGPA
jgi:hypothetical protein